MSSSALPRILPRTASEAVAAFRDGTLSPTDYAAECLANVDAFEPTLRAFAALDRQRIVQGAAGTNSGLPLGGIPIGIKDVIDTAGLATTFGSPLYEGRSPATNAACIDLLEALGAYVFGKTTTVEFASLGRVPPTANPYDVRHTPGGSSCGSAAAVAAGMVPIALGTQTGGSLIRPASFCGVMALKPTFGLVRVDGMRAYAPSLDTIGWMARSVADLALLLAGFGASAATVPTTPLRIGVYRSAYWAEADADSRAAIAFAAERLRAAGAELVDVDTNADEDRLNEWQNIVMHAEGQRTFRLAALAFPDRLHPEQQAEVDHASGVDAGRLSESLDALARMRVRMDARLGDFDAWLTPAVPGAAPRGLARTGDAVFNRLWTALHVPAVTLPGYRNAAGLPIGVQLIAPRWQDAALLQVAGQVEAALRA